MSDPSFKRRNNSPPPIVVRCELASRLFTAQDLSLIHLDIAEVAQLSGTNVRIIESLHQNGSGPPSIRLGARTVRFRASDVISWLDDRSVHSQ